jgi:menaquinone-dependent protoporphyrinogen oxidase
MKPLLVVFSTREGQAEDVAAEIQRAFLRAGKDANIVDLEEVEDVDLGGHAGVVLVASVHLGKHEPEMVAFARKHHAELDQVPSAFVSVSLTEALVEEMGRDESERVEAAHEVERFTSEFLKETGWHPVRVKPVAGAIRYSEYGWVLRFMMKQVASRLHLDTDTSHDAQYTDWRDLEHFAQSFVDLVEWCAIETKPTPETSGS